MDGNAPTNVSCCFSSGRSRPGELRWWLAPWALPLWLVAIACLTSSAGCRGCIGPRAEQLSREEQEKLAREQKEAIQASQLLSLPADSEIKTISAKPGHWVETVRQVKSNREDLQVVATGDVLRGADKVLNIPGTNVVAEFARPTILPKGQTKTIDLQYFVPTTSIAVDPLNPVSTALRLRSSLLSRSLLTPLLQEPFPTNELKHAEFLMVVVSPKPLDYAFLSSTDLALWRGSDMMLEERTRSYHVILCGSDAGKIALPTSMLTMTTTAVIVWDDLAPDDLSEDQKHALIDWLHWGGQLVISGPSSWARLQNSFLVPYLPITEGTTIELATEDFAPLNKWIVPDRTSSATEPIEIVGSKVPGLEMKLSPEGSWLPHTAELVAERAVGRGRVVVTGFPLREQRLYRWKYYASFFSTGLLRRPARKVSKSANALVQLWDEPFGSMERDPRLNSQLRIASRDMPLARNASARASSFAAQSERELLERANPRRAGDLPQITPPVPTRSFTESSPEAVQWSANGGAWSDTSGFAFSALSTLRDAAGIVLPDRWTIGLLLGGYLLVLVPLNWLVFRLLGRLEWAWIAAPVIALIGVVIVTRVARLDIGFARRTTEIGLIELHGEYPRGHVTNYAALYTSLSTPYALEFPERGSVALPLGDISRSSQRRNASPVQKISAKFGTSAGIRLEPVTVYSNSTEMLHSEQMVTLGGGLLYGVDDQTPEGAAVKNETGLALKGCCLVRKTSSGQGQFAWIGDMTDNQTHRVRFAAAADDAPWQYWNQSAITRHPTLDATAATDDEDPSDANGAVPDGQAEASGLVVGGLLRELLSAVPLVPGQVRLIGYTDDRPGKIIIEPADGRLDSRTVVLAHLRPADWTELTPDREIIGRLPNLPDLNEPEPPPAE